MHCGGAIILTVFISNLNALPGITYWVIALKGRLGKWTGLGEPNKIEAS